jgi:hypothetical protein
MRRVEFGETNNEGNYATHGYFRYFGKLPPSVLSYIIKEGTRYAEDGPVVDLMCGCGTSLVESMIMGHPSIGVDVNPVATLISKVKTTLVDEGSLCTTLNDIIKHCESLSHNEVSGLIPRFRNVDYWFDSQVQLELAKLKYAISKIEDLRCHDFFIVAFLSIIRRVSNGSPRVGRLFHIKHDRPLSVKEVFFDKANEMIKKMRELRWLAKCTEVQVSCEDARDTSLEANSAAFVIVHPPYFALYKYSSDVLRFELEWFGANRKELSTHEIVDGFKTTNINVYRYYVEDVCAVLSEAQRILKSGHQVCLIINNSTFRDERLPVVDDISTYLAKYTPGLKLVECLERGLRFQQASYHRSAREDKVTSQDYLVFFQKTAPIPEAHQLHLQVVQSPITVDNSQGRLANT